MIDNVHMIPVVLQKWGTIIGIERSIAITPVVQFCITDATCIAPEIKVLKETLMNDVQISKCCYFGIERTHSTH